MKPAVIDASIAIKWVVEESGTQDALAVLKGAAIKAPDLLLPECANILWKKVERKELLQDEAMMAARLILQVDMELFTSRGLLEDATRLSLELNHPAYDCIYLALAMQNGWPFITADRRLLSRLALGGPARISNIALSLADGAALCGAPRRVRK